MKVEFLDIMMMVAAIEGLKVGGGLEAEDILSMINEYEADKKKNDQESSRTSLDDLIRRYNETRKPDEGVCVSEGNEASESVEKDELFHSLHVPTNISKTDGTVFIQMVVPGYEEDQVTVTTDISEGSDQHVLVVTGEPIAREDQDEIIIQDFFLDGFTSTIEISKEIADGQYSIELQNGVLSIKIIPAKKTNNARVVF